MVFNIIFPMWMLYCIPTLLWLLIIPGNFAIDTLVILIGSKVSKISDFKTLFKKTIIGTWLFGFLSDFIGALVSTLMLFIREGISLSIDYTEYLTLLFITIPGIIVAGVLIFVFNRFVVYKKLDLTNKEKTKMALWLALLTAPYTMLLPVNFY